MSTPTSRRRARRVTLAAAIVVALAAGGVAVWMREPWKPGPVTSAQEASAAAVTVPVERGRLTDQVRLNATLDYGDPVELPAAQGMITALPASGQVVKVGSSVYESDGHPVILLRGARPLWRDLTQGVDDGQDVLQLERNLARLGLFGREPDTRFTWWTTDAIKRWQRSLDLPVTGTVATGDVVVVDAPSVRVSHVTGELGQTGVSPLTYTATTLRAVATLTAAQARELQPGDPVTVVLPDGTELENTIEAVDPGGQPTGEEDQTTPPTAKIDFADQEQVSATGPASIRVIVQSRDRSAETLIVPATALIATASNSYAVEVLTGDGIARVPVQIGRVVDAQVQILASGPDVEGAPGGARGIAEGDEVVISR